MPARCNRWSSKTSRCKIRVGFTCNSGRTSLLHKVASMWQERHPPKAVKRDECSNKSPVPTWNMGRSGCLIVGDFPSQSTAPMLLVWLLRGALAFKTGWIDGWCSDRERLDWCASGRFLKYLFVPWRYFIVASAWQQQWHVMGALTLVHYIQPFLASQQRNMDIR